MNALRRSRVSTSVRPPALRGFRVALGMVLLTGSVWIGTARAADPDDCLLCHQFRGLSRLDTETNRLHAFYVDPDYHRLLAGPHARLACTDCHQRDAVSVIPHQPVAPVNCTQTCHLVQPGGIEQRFSHANVADVLAKSVHDPATLGAIRFSGGDLLADGQSTCLYCHDEPLFREPSARLGIRMFADGSALDRCQACHDEQLPTDVRYYLRHIASRLQPARPNLELAQVCAVCHSDRSVREQFGLPDSVASFVRSFHGKAALLGSETTADCLDCHASGRGNAHLLLSHTDAASSVHRDRIADSCTTIECHPGASPQLSATSMHLDVPAQRGSIEFLLAAAFVLVTLLTFGPSAVLAVLEILQLVIGRVHHGDQRLHNLARRVADHPVGRARLVRFTPAQRVQHWVLAILFTLLVLTGFPMKFASASWSRTVIGWFGGLENARLVHHWAGLALVVGFLAHVGHILVTVIRRAKRSNAAGLGGFWQTFVALPMWMTLDDGRKALQLLGYLCFLCSEKPSFGRFSVKEKFEYIGVFWGTVILGVTGLILWGEGLASHLLTGKVLNLALIAHTYESYLAAIHVGILHLYSVVLSPHVLPLSPAMITGTTPLAELVENHSDFLRDVAQEVGVASEVTT